MDGFLALLLFAAIVAAFVVLKNLAQSGLSAGVEKFGSSIKRSRPIRWWLVPQTVSVIDLLEGVAERTDDLVLRVTQFEGRGAIEVSAAPGQDVSKLRGEVLAMARSIDPQCTMRLQ